MMKKIVITGGPSSGKTSILLALKDRGEHIVRESATDWIMYKQACGIRCPWKDEDFQLQILRLQKIHEQMIHPDIKRVFLDRSRLDGLAYLEVGTDAYKKVEAGSQEVRYDLVFITEPLDFVATNIVRRENKKEAEELHKKFKTIYRAAGYDPIIIKKGDLENRVQDVLQYL